MSTFYDGSVYAGCHLVLFHGRLRVTGGMNSEGSRSWTMRKSTSDPFLIADRYSNGSLTPKDGLGMPALRL